MRRPDPRRAAVLTVIAVVAALCVMFNPASVGGASAASTCSHLTVTGRVKSGGSIKRGWAVAVFLHNRSAALTAGRTGPKGGFSVRLCRTAAVRRYATRHHGHINLDVIAHRRARRGAFLVRTVAPSLRVATVSVPARFVRMKTISPHARATTSNGVVNAGATTAKTITTGVDYSRPFTVYPPAMYLEKVPGETTTWSISSDHLNSVATSVGADGDSFSVAGSIAIETAAGFETGGHIYAPKGASTYAVTVRPAVDTSMTYTCHLGWRSFRLTVGMLGMVCSWGMDASWNGDVRTPRATYLGCHAGTAKPQDVTNHSRDRYSASAGVTFTAKAGFKTPYVTGDFSTTYGAGTNYLYTLQQTKRVHHFCVGGNGPTVALSSALYITNTDGTTGSGCAGARSVPAARWETAQPEQHPGGSC